MGRRSNFQRMTSLRFSSSSRIAPETRCTWPLSAWTIQKLSHGRMLLGLGVIPHSSHRVAVVGHGRPDRLRENAILASHASLEADGAPLGLDQDVAGFDELAALPQVTLMPLDVTDSKNVREVAAEIGGKVDILINNAEYHRAYGIANRAGVDTARAEMDVNYFGLLRLAQEFGPALRSRGADGLASATAWVNVLSIYALANFPPHGTFSASKAAAHSLAQCLRAEMRPAGVRVINVFPGPLDDDWNQLLPPPKIAPAALANAIVKALQQGVEDAYPGDVAQEWLARWRDNPKALEKELST